MGGFDPILMNILTDIIRSFFYITLEGLYFMFQIIYGLVNTFTRVISNVVQPALVEGLSDINFVFTIIFQGVLSASRDTLLGISKLTLHAAKYLHNLSEKIIEKSWYQN